MAFTSVPRQAPAAAAAPQFEDLLGFGGATAAAPAAAAPAPSGGEWADFTSFNTAPPISQPQAPQLEAFANFGASPQVPQQQAFASFGASPPSPQMAHRQAPQPQASASFGAPLHSPQATPAGSNDWADFTSFASAPPAAQPQAPQPHSLQLQRNGANGAHANDGANGADANAKLFNLLDM